MSTSVVRVLLGALLCGRLLVGGASMDPYHHGGNAAQNYQPWLYQSHDIHHGVVSTPSPWHSEDPHTAFPDTWPYFDLHAEPSLPVHQDALANNAVGTPHSALQGQRGDPWSSALQRPDSPHTELHRDMLEALLRAPSRPLHGSAAGQDFGGHYPILESQDHPSPHKPLTDPRYAGTFQDFVDYKRRLQDARVFHRMNEPPILQSLVMLPPIGDQEKRKGLIKFGKDQPLVRQLINSKIFDNKLEWVDVKEFKDFGRTLSKNIQWLCHLVSCHPLLCPHTR